MNIKKNILFFPLVMGLAVMAAACSSDKPEGKGTVVPTEESGRPQAAAPQAAAQYRLHVVPPTAVRGSSLLLVAEGFSLENARIEWRVNGVSVPSATAARFKTDNVRRGDTVQAAVFVNGREMLTDAITIGNSPPEFTKIKIMPEIFRPGDLFFAEVTAEDPDDDEVTIRYEWLVNNQPAGNSKTIGLPVKRGDVMTLKLSASDGKISSTPVVLKREIRNMPPMISDETALTCDANTCSGRVLASDPDGDNLVFSLKKGPEGASIGPDTGLVQWKIPAAFAGRDSIVVSVADGHGGEATKTFSFDVPK
jgi:hypothetical protein